LWIDMSAAYINAIQEHLLHAEIVHDKFHISQNLGYAVDKTRRVSMPCFRSRVTNR
jgi:transposase